MEVKLDFLEKYNQFWLNSNNELRVLEIFIYVRLNGGKRPLREMDSHNALSHFLKAFTA